MPAPEYLARPSLEHLVKARMKDLGVSFIPPEEQPEMNEVDLNLIRNQDRDINPALRSVHRHIVDYLELETLCVEGLDYDSSAWKDWRAKIQPKFESFGSEGITVFRAIIHATKYSSSSLTLLLNALDGFFLLRDHPLEEERLLLMEQVKSLGRDPEGKHPGNIGALCTDLGNLVLSMENYPSIIGSLSA